jgi:ATP-dependent RNA helicase
MTAEGKFDYTSDGKIIFDTSEEVKVVPTFDTMGLKEDLLRGIYAFSKSSHLVLV